MIKFFRHIRKSLLANNRVGSPERRSQVGKYLLYAIGEIILVVIGIMIAVQLNNKNQDRVQQKEIESILIKIQKEIVADLYASNFKALRYEYRDSIKNRILNRQITYDELKTGKTNLFIYSNGYFLFSIQTKGYDQLMGYLDDMPEAYDDLLKRLSSMYRNRNLQINRYKEQIWEVRGNYTNYLAEHESWYGQDIHRRNISDAQIDFYLNDPYFFNYITRINQAHFILVRDMIKWRFEARTIYHMINEVLGENSQMVPDVARTSSLTSVSEANKYVGTYVLTKGLENNSLGSKLVVKSNEKNLYIQFSDGRESTFLMTIHETKPCFVLDEQAFVFRFEHHGANTLSVVMGKEDQTDWIKMEDD